MFPLVPHPDAIVFFLPAAAACSIAPLSARPCLACSFPSLSSLSAPVSKPLGANDNEGPPALPKVVCVGPPSPHKLVRVMFYRKHPNSDLRGSMQNTNRHPLRVIIHFPLTTCKTRFICVSLCSTEHKIRCHGKISRLKINELC
jgi:hypothetical protein